MADYDKTGDTIHTFDPVIKAKPLKKEKIQTDKWYHHIPLVSVYAFLSGMFIGLLCYQGLMTGIPIASLAGSAWLTGFVAFAAASLVYTGLSFLTRLITRSTSKTASGFLLPTQVLTTSLLIGLGAGLFNFYHLLSPIPLGIASLSLSALVTGSIVFLAATMMTMGFIATTQYIANSKNKIDSDKKIKSQPKSIDSVPQDEKQNEVENSDTNANEKKSEKSLSSLQDQLDELNSLLKENNASGDRQANSENVRETLANVTGLLSDSGSERSFATAPRLGSGLSSIFDDDYNYSDDDSETHALPFAASVGRGLGLENRSLRERVSQNEADIQRIIKDYPKLHKALSDFLKVLNKIRKSQHNVNLLSVEARSAFNETTSMLLNHSRNHDSLMRDSGISRRPRETITLEFDDGSDVNITHGRGRRCFPCTIL